MSQTTGSQHITPELKRWVTEQFANGATADLLLASMLNSGWERDLATAALTAAPAASCGVPQPLVGGLLPSLRAADREVQLLVSLRSPARG